MNRTTISLIELFNRFPDQEAARSYMEAQRWPEGTVCPHCAETERIHNRGWLLPLQRLPGGLHRAHWHYHGAFPCCRSGSMECTCW